MRVDMKFFMLIILLIAAPVFADELKTKDQSATDQIHHQSSEDEYITIDGIQYKNNKIPVQDDSHRRKHGKHKDADDRSYEGYPYYGNPKSFTPNGKSYTIIKEKETVREIIREVPAPVPEPVKEKKWIPPVYGEKTIPGHYIGGITETVDENGVRVFTDDGTLKEWVPEKTIQVIITPGYYE